MKKLIAGILAVSAAAGVLQGCNTTKGFGEDMANTGTNIQRGVKSVDPNVGNATNQTNETRK